MKKMISNYIVIYLKIVIMAVFLICKTTFADNKDISIGTVQDGVSIFDLTSEGKKCWELHGTSAKFIENGFVEIKNVEAIFYQQNKKENDKVVINTDSAKVNQSSKYVTTEEDVKIKSKDILVVGKGLDGYMGEKTVRIKKDVTMTITGENKGILFSK